MAAPPVETAATDATPTPAKHTAEHVVAVLERAGWNRRKAAKLLGISHNTFYLRLDRDPHLRELLD